MAAIPFAVRVLLHSFAVLALLGVTADRAFVIADAIDAVPIFQASSVSLLAWVGTIYAVYPVDRDGRNLLDVLLLGMGLLVAAQALALDGSFLAVPTVVNVAVCGAAFIALGRRYRAKRDTQISSAPSPPAGAVAVEDPLE